MPYINRRFTDCRRFPCSISVKSIVVVMSQKRDATRKFAIATTRRSFATNFGNKLYPLLSLRRCNVDSAFLKSGRCLTGIVSEPTKFERIHQLPRYTSSSSVAIWVWSSFASLSISRITSSERPNSSIVFLNHKSRINRSWMFKNCRFFLHFFWSWFAVWYSLSPSFFPYLWPCGRPFLM